MKESDKTRAQKAEDVAYTINHALACTATDMIDPFIGNWTQKYLGKRVSIGCGHDHSKDHAHSHECQHEPPKAATPFDVRNWKPAAKSPAPCHHDHGAKSHLGHWWAGEIAGDFGAVPFTIAVQRFAPRVMDGLRLGMEPLLGPFFRNGARRAARGWAKAQGLPADSAECKNKEEEIYSREVKHLPQALLWTVSSIAINLSVQKITGNKAPLWHLAAGKAVGAGISAGLVVSGRAMAPETAYRWDRFTSQRIFLPVAKTTAALLGTDKEANWAERAREPGNARERQ